MINKAVLAAMAVLIAAVPAVAEELETAPIDATFVSPYAATFSFVVYGDEAEAVPSGTWTDTVNVDGDVLKRQVNRYSNDGIVNLSRIIVADRTHLMPAVLDQRFGPGLSGVMHADYDGAVLRQVLIASPSGAMRVIETELDEPAWELSLWATLAMSIPFDEGSQVRLPVVGADRQSITQATFEVGGAEPLEFGGETLSATRVHALEADWIFWVRKAPPYILQIDHPAGGEGLRATSTLETFELVE